MINYVAKIVLVLYVVILSWLVLFKLSFDVSSLLFAVSPRIFNLIPFAITSDDHLREMLYNFIVFVPLGLLLRLNFRRISFWRLVSYVFFFSLGVELIQFLFAIGVMDITDLLLNTLGGLVGVALYKLASRRYAMKKIDRYIIAICIVLVAIFILLRLFVFKVNYGSVSTVKVSVESSLLKNAQLSWPAVGYAAVGTVEDGLLASSSENESPLPMASMAKIITALAIMQKQPFALGQTGQTYVITRDDIASLSAYIAEEGSVLPLKIGMEVTQYEAMQRMLIASDNNIADILAKRVFGSMDAYVAYAQDMLSRMGLHYTVVDDASGFSSQTVGTPSELVKIGIAALKNPVIAEIVAKSQVNLPVVGTIHNTNELLGTDGIIGIKTGTTNAAGSCLLFAARYMSDNGDAKTIVGVIMGSKNATDRFSDSRTLLLSVKRQLGLDAAESEDNANTSSQTRRPIDLAVPRL